MIKISDNTLLIVTVMLIFMISYLNFDPDKTNKMIRYDCKLLDKLPSEVKDHCIRLYGENYRK